MEEIKNENVDKSFESNIDFKGTLASFLKEDEPELSQEEAIKKYTENTKKRKHNNDSDGEDAYSEEEEHLKRVKQELLASLERVKKLENQIFVEKDKVVTSKKIKVSGNNGGMQGSISRMSANEQIKKFEKEREN